LKQELASMREQLMKVKHGARGKSPPPPHRPENGFLTAGANLSPPITKRGKRRHSSAESWGPNEVIKRKGKTSVEIPPKTSGFRPVSVSYTQSPFTVIRSPGGRIRVPGTEDDPVDEVLFC
jgi:hypothetical protein